MRLEAALLVTSARMEWVHFGVPYDIDRAGTFPRKRLVINGGEAGARHCRAWAELDRHRARWRADNRLIALGGSGSSSILGVLKYVSITYWREFLADGR